MNKEPLEIAKSLKEEIDSLSLMQEYLALKKLYSENKELQEMRQNIARLKNENKDEERQNLIAIYNSHPLVNNYNLVKEELTELLLEIKEIIEK